MVILCVWRIFVIFVLKWIDFNEIKRGFLIFLVVVKVVEKGDLGV